MSQTHPSSLSKAQIIWSIKASLIIIIGLVLIHTPMWLKGHSLGWDAMNESWGDLSYAIQALQDGYFPFWNHLERGGYPFIADPQTAVLYPINWVIYLSGMIFGLGPWLPVLRSLLHFFIGALGCHILALSWRASSGLSILFSSLYIYSGRLLKSKDNAGLWTMVWLPWLMWTLDKLITQPSYKNARNLSLILTLSFYAGYPPNLARSLIFLSIWALYKLTQKYRSQSTQVQSDISFASYSISLFSALAQSALMTILLCAPGIVSTLQVLSESERGKLSLAQLLMSRFHLLDTLDILSPRFIHAQSYALTYIGLVGLCLVLVFLSSRYISKTERLFFFVLCTITLLWTCGRNVHFLEYFVKYVPSFNLWRIAEQYAFLSVFCLSLMALKAGLMIENLNKDLQANILQRIKRLTQYLGLLLLFLVGTNLLRSELSKSLFFSLGILSTIYLLTKSVNASWFTLNKFWFILSLISLGDVAFQQQDLVKISQAVPKPHRDRLVKNTKLHQRFADHNYLRWRPGARLNHADLNGRYSTMVNRKWHRYMQSAKKSSNLYAWGSVVQVFQRGQRPKSIRFSAPYIFWTNHVYYSEHSAQLLQTMKKSSPQQGLSVFLEKGSRLSTIPSPRTNLQSKTDHQIKPRLKVRKAKWGKVSVELEASQDGYLVLNERYSPWWRARVDHNDWQATNPANYIFQAIYVPKGKHYIYLEYRETPTYIALLLSLFTIIFMSLAHLMRQANHTTETLNLKIDPV